ncbi:MAG TPA: hypothetical protein ENJ09_05445 [Planctomycetes bacterium]|nr:hypothetical protein [Planctomycetota bacterium]
MKALWGLRDEAVIARQLNRPVASVRRMAEKLFPEGVRRGPWTAAEVLRLKRYLGASPPEVIARVLGRDVEEVQRQILDLGRIRREEEWSREEIAELKRLYGTRTTEDLEVIFGRSSEEIEARAKEYALSKDKAFLRKIRGESATRMPRWTQQEIDVLKRDYPSRSNLDIARELGRSVKSVVSKAHNLGLKKSPDRLRAMGRENVSLRYEK